MLHERMNSKAILAVQGWCRCVRCGMRELPIFGRRVSADEYTCDNV